MKVSDLSISINDGIPEENVMGKHDFCPKRKDHSTRNGAIPEIVLASKDNRNTCDKCQICCTGSFWVIPHRIRPWTQVKFVLQDGGGDTDMAYIPSTKPMIHLCFRHTWLSRSVLQVLEGCGEFPGTRFRIMIHSYHSVLPTSDPRVRAGYSPNPYSSFTWCHHFGWSVMLPRKYCFLVI